MSEYEVAIRRMRASSCTRLPRAGVERGVVGTLPSGRLGVVTPDGQLVVEQDDVIDEWPITLPEATAADEYATVSGAYVTLAAPDGSEIEATVLWDARPAYCQAGSPGHGKWEWTSRPGLTVAPDGAVVVQHPWCHHCGRRYELAAAVSVGIVDGEPLDDMAYLVGIDADDAVNYVRWDILAELNRRVRAAAASLDVATMPSLDAVGPWTVGRDEDGLVGAWAPDPFGGDDLVVVTSAA